MENYQVMENFLHSSEQGVEGNVIYMIFYKTEVLREENIFMTGKRCIC